MRFQLICSRALYRATSKRTPRRHTCIASQAFRTTSMKSSLDGLEGFFFLTWRSCEVPPGRPPPGTYTERSAELLRSCVMASAASPRPPPASSPPSAASPHEGKRAVNVRVCTGEQWLMYPFPRDRSKDDARAARQHCTNACEGRRLHCRGGVLGMCALRPAHRVMSGCAEK